MCKILVIEDEAAVRRNVARILEIEGFDVIQAENGRLGLSQAQLELPNLIICDIMMPELDGYAVKTELSQDPATALIPFIYLSAKAERSDVRLGISLGADDYITKPFTRDELLGAILARLDKQKTIQLQVQTRLESMRQEIIQALPTKLLVPLTQVQEGLKILMKDSQTLSPTAVCDLSQGAYASSLLLQRQVQNYLLYALLEVAIRDPAQAQLLRDNCTTMTDEPIRLIALSKAQKVGRNSDVQVKLTDVALPMLESNLTKLAEELIDNAIKFSRKGSRVWVQGNVEKDYFVLQVMNQGPGISAGQLDAMGAQFCVNQRIKGTSLSGLGLAIADNLAQLHGGDLQVNSIPNGITTVTVRIPLQTSI
jgi:DNA-binding response OmpR family regulator